jgi:hypothetical protein
MHLSSRGGGLMVYIPQFKVRDDIQITTSGFHEIEYIWLEVQFPKSHSFLVGFIYQPDNTSQWRDKFEQLLRLIMILVILTAIHLTKDHIDHSIILYHNFSSNNLLLVLLAHLQVL